MLGSDFGILGKFCGWGWRYRFGI